MRENCTSGSVRGGSGNRGSYRKMPLRDISNQVRIWSNLVLS